MQPPIMDLPAVNRSAPHRVDSRTVIMAGHGGGSRAIRTDALLTEAQRHLGLPPAPAPHQPSGPRRWPAGQSGSFSHWGEYTLCLCHRGIGQHWGVDIEGLPDADTTQDILSIALSPEERDLLSRSTQKAADLSRLAVSVFSAKESFYKAAFPLVGRVFGFEVLRLAAPPSCAGLQFTLVTPLARVLPAGMPVSIRCHANAKAVISWCCLPAG